MKTTKLLTQVSIAVAFALSAGCATTNNQSQAVETVDQAALDASKLTAELDSRSSSLDNREAELQQAQASFSQTQNDAENAEKNNISDLLPPDAQSGECYARVWVADSYKTVSDSVLATEQSERIEVTPAEYEWTTETVEVEQESSRVVTSAAVYGTESEQVMVSDARMVWRRSLNHHSAEISDGLLQFAENHGADIDSAHSGVCFHEHTTPATYSTEEESILISEASHSLTAIPATYRMTETTVTVSEASTRIVQIPATYKTVSEQVLVKEAHTTWKKGTGPIQRIDESTGEIMCLVEVPAVYKTVFSQVVDSAATTETIVIPAEYKTIQVREMVSAASEQSTPIEAKYGSVSKRVQTADSDVVWHEIHNTQLSKQSRTGQQICLTEEPSVYKTVNRRVVITPASSHQVVIPAQYKTVKVRKLLSEATETRIDIPATYKSVERQELDSEGFMQWRSILCETNTTAARITQLQRALEQKGYEPGPIDGVVGYQTMSAVNAFQLDESLPIDKYLNVETVKALGVSVQ